MTVPLAPHEVAQHSTLWAMDGIASVVLPKDVGEDASGDAQQRVRDAVKREGGAGVSCGVARWFRSLVLTVLRGNEAW